MRKEVAEAHLATGKYASMSAFLDLRLYSDGDLVLEGQALGPSMDGIGIDDVEFFTSVGPKHLSRLVVALVVDYFNTIADMNHMGSGRHQCEKTPARPDRAMCRQVAHRRAQCQGETLADRSRQTPDTQACLRDGPHRVRTGPVPQRRRLSSLAGPEGHPLGVLLLLNAYILETMRPLTDRTVFVRDSDAIPADVRARGQGRRRSLSTGWPADRSPVGTGWPTTRGALVAAACGTAV
ncbi:hypothetical protein BMS3Bbin01_02763 [bacterium BMS3Bbin01]|nr:hypothetical protein BMS3Bbin01_02763 [bacterium BMS3Bbin01]